MIHRVATCPFALRLLVAGMLVTSLPAVPRAELRPETMLATSAAGEVTYGDLSEEWPHLGNDAEKIRVVREALKERIYAQEAELAKLDTAPEIEEQFSEARLSAYLEALFLREKGEVEITEEEIRTYYEAHRDLYYLDEHIYLRHIALDIPSPSDETSRLQTKARAIEALARLEAGEAFDAVCRQYTSDTLYGPSRIGPVPTQDIPDGWGQKVVQLQPGQRSNVLELPLRFEIVEVLEHHPAGPLPFEPVRSTIQAALFREQRREAQAEFVTEILNSIDVTIDHRAIADPATKPGKVVVKAEGLKMSKDDYEQWASRQSALSRYALRDARKRVAIVRKNLLLRPWLERTARKRKLDREPVFKVLFERLRRAILAKAFEKYLFAQNPSFLEVTEEEIQQYYATHLDDFRTPEQAEIRDIIIKADVDIGHTPEAHSLASRYALEQAKEIMQKLDEGIMTFAMAALKYGSTDEPGVFFRVDRGTQGDQFDEVVFALEPGELSAQPVRTDEGYRLVQLSKTIPAVQLPLPEVRGSIVRDLEREKAGRLRDRLQEQYLEKANARMLTENFLRGPAD